MDLESKIASDDLMEDSQQQSEILIEGFRKESFFDVGKFLWLKASEIVKTSQLTKDRFENLSTASLASNVSTGSFLTLHNYSRDLGVC